MSRYGCDSNTNATSTQQGSWKISGITAQTFADTVLGGSRPPIVAITIAVAVLLLSLRQHWHALAHSLC